MQAEFIPQVLESSYFAIYGAQVVAYGVFTALQALYGVTPVCFVVSGTEGNPAEIGGVPVCGLIGCGLDNDTFVLVAVTELLQDEVCSALESEGFYNYVKIGAHEEHLLMSEYYQKINKFPLLAPSAGHGRCGLTIYEVKCHRDKPLADPPLLTPWVQSIQAGTDNTDLRIAPLFDNTGVNISSKNILYCEMTAAYWVWKNTSHAWKGICHYRRYLELSEGQVAALANGDIDAILPLPYLCYPNALSQFRRFVSGAVKDTLLASLLTLHPDKYDEYFSILEGPYQYAYNLLAARCDVFDSYCEWVFGVLEHMERSADAVPEIAQTRALSYCSEALTSLYFLSNSDRLNIRHAEKRIYV